MDHPIFSSAHELAVAIRRRETSSLEVVDAHLAHVGRHNPRLNAVVTVDEAGSRARAMAADAALDGGGVWGQLHGVPITLEDCHPTSGVRSTWGGLPRLADHVPDEDGAVAARLKAAGAVLLGKTHGPEVWPDSVFPRTNNPWNEARTPGGSSSGAPRPRLRGRALPRQPPAPRAAGDVRPARLYRAAARLQGRVPLLGRREAGERPNRQVRTVCRGGIAPSRPAGAYVARSRRLSPRPWRV